MHWSDYAVSPSQRHQKHWWKFALAQHCCSGRQIQMEVLHSNADEQHYHWGRSENYVTGYMLQPALSLNSSKVAEYSASMTTTAATSHTTSIQQNILGSKTNSQVTLYKQMHFPNSLFMLHTRFQKKIEDEKMLGWYMAIRWQSWTVPWKDVTHCEVENALLSAWIQPTVDSVNYSF